VDGVFDLSSSDLVEGCNKPAESDCFFSAIMTKLAATLASLDVVAWGV